MSLTGHCPWPCLVPIMMMPLIDDVAVSVVVGFR
jgi:hypothetical protein